MIGAANDDDMGDEAGAAYIFNLDIKSGWIQFKKLTAIDGGPSDLFGSSVSLHENLFVVGATGASDSGAAYVFDFNNITRTNIPIEKFVASDGQPGDLLGSSVSLWGGKTLVGAFEADIAPASQDSNTGAAYVFVQDVIFVDGFD